MADKAEPAPLPPLLASLRLIAAAPAISPPPPPAPRIEPPPQPAPSISAKPAKPLPRHQERLSTHQKTASAAPPQAPASPPPTSVQQAATPIAAEPAVAPPEVATPSPPAIPQANLLAAYRQRLTDFFASQQQYPRIAALRGWEGEVRLRLRVARKGNLVAVQLDHSSGFDVLDQHALSMLQQLAGLPPLPDGLDANEIQVVVPVNYKLKKTT